jgi:cytidine deaminase
VLPFDRDGLIAQASAVAGRFAASSECEAGSVGAAVLSTSGQVFTGICVDTRCSLGFCAEHAAVAEMLKHRQTGIVAMVAVNDRGDILPPCGRCRELIRQLDPANWRSVVLLPNGAAAELGGLLPYESPVGPAGG